MYVAVENTDGECYVKNTYLCAQGGGEQLGTSDKLLPVPILA